MANLPALCAANFFHMTTEGYSLFAYSRFAYSRFAYFRPKSGVSPTRKKQLYVNINELFNVQYNNNTTLLDTIFRH